MKIKKYLISAMAIFLMGSMVACQSKPAENKKAEEKRKKRKKNLRWKRLLTKKKFNYKIIGSSKAIELEIPNLKDADKESIEKKYANLIAQVKEDKIDKAEVIKLGKAAENYIKNVKESRGEKTEEKK